MGAMSLVVIYFNMVWLYRSPVVVGRKGALSRSNNFYLPSRWKQEEERGDITL
jgi:hypothetical protein